MVWILDNWQDFDAWCCIKGVDPLEIPSYRFYNLAVFSLKENRTSEQIQTLEETLEASDMLLTPIEIMQRLFRTAKVTTTKKAKPSTPAAVKKEYVPSWWRGDAVNAKVAMKMMTQLPKG